jgi:catechol 2,3-dioxygenase-like lactoylglutathione lyase family enzyme
MNPTRVDHVTLRIPETEPDRAIAFYRGALGLGLEGHEAYQQGEKPIFTFRVGPTTVIHVRPVSGTVAPADQAFDHVALVFDQPIERIKADLAAADIPIEREGTPRGAGGTARAVYVRDPFGYLVELKEAVSVADD